MGKLYIFRGKAATGKTVITDLVSRELKICILRKDDIYDMLPKENMEHATKNKLSYDILVQVINTNLTTNCELIIDIGLSNPLHLNEFINKLAPLETEIIHFLCICSNEGVWRERMKARIENPTPNQLFKTVDDAVRHYKGNEATTRIDDVVLDSSEDLSEIVVKVKRVIANRNL